MLKERGPRKIRFAKESRLPNSYLLGWTVVPVLKMRDLSICEVVFLITEYFRR